MIRVINIVLVCTSIAGLVGVYALKYTVEETAGERVALLRQIDRQESELSLVKADWAYLNQPARISPIIARHASSLGLEPTKPTQFGSLEDLPMRPVIANDTAALDSLFQSLEMGIDPIEQLIEAESQ